MPFAQIGADASATFLGNYNDFQGSQFSRTIIGGNQNHTTVNITIGANSAAELSLHHFLQGARPSNEAASDTAYGTPQIWQQQAMAAADGTSGLIVSIVHLLVNRTESSDLKRILELLNHTIVMIRLALQLFEHTPLGGNLARTIKPAILNCRASLQDLFDKLEGYREGISVTGIRLLWSRVIWGEFDNQELKEKLEMHQVFLMGFIAALDSISWTDLGNELQTVVVSLREFQTSFRRGPLRLQHVVPNQIVVIDQLGRNIPIPTIFCSSWQDFHYILSGYCEGRMGVNYVRDGDFQLIRSIDHEAIKPSDLVREAQPDSVFEISIVLKRTRKLCQRKCLRCRHANGTISSDGWIECRKCSGQFRVDQSVDREMVDGLLETTASTPCSSKGFYTHGVGSSSKNEVVDEIPFFRRIQILATEDDMLADYMLVDRRPQLESHVWKRSENTLRFLGITKPPSDFRCPDIIDILET